VFSTARCFYITSQWNGKVLDVRGDEASAGASLIVYERKPVVTANQVWYEDENGLLRSKLNGYVIDTSCELIVHRYILLFICSFLVINISKEYAVKYEC